MIHSALNKSSILYKSTMSGNSNVGNRQVYEAGDQRNPKASEMGSGTRYHEGTAHAHLPNDSSTPIVAVSDPWAMTNRPPEDQRSLSNRAAAEVRTNNRHVTSFPKLTTAPEILRGRRIPRDIAA
jgi:hypothetical protein